MARKLPDAYTSPPDTTSINLTHLVSRLESNLLSPSADLKPFRSHYHRARVAANIEYGRTLLLQLERSLSTSNIKAQTRKQTQQSDLLEKRKQLKILQKRLDELGIEARAAAAISSSSESGSGTGSGVDAGVFSSEEDEEEDILATPQNSTPSTTSRPSTDPRGGIDDRHAPYLVASSETSFSSQVPTPTSPSSSTLSAEEADPFTNNNNTLRSRNVAGNGIATSASAHTTTALSTGITPGSRHTAAKTTSPLNSNTTTNSESPLSSSSTPTSTSTSAADPKTQSSEAALTQSRIEQDSLTDSLLSLATQLKSSTQNFNTSLESEKSVLDRAVEGLDKNTTGMDAAGKRMGMLRRMSEGKGWWGRMMMYFWIFGLWVAALLIMFLGPKLRF